MATLEGTADWTPDVWGRIRRRIESQAAGAQVSAADLANAQLSAQGTLATDYFNLRAADSLRKLLEDTVAAYQRVLQITTNQYSAGTISRADVVTAQAQLQAVVAQLAGVGVQRTQFEHAIAMLTGHPPADLSIPFSPLPDAVPLAPVALPRRHGRLHKRHHGAGAVADHPTGGADGATEPVGRQRCPGRGARRWLDERATTVDGGGQTPQSLKYRAVCCPALSLSDGTGNSNPKSRFGFLAYPARN